MIESQLKRLQFQVQISISISGLDNSSLATGLGRAYLLSFMPYARPGLRPDPLYRSLTSLIGRVGTNMWSLLCKGKLIVSNPNKL